MIPGASIERGSDMAGWRGVTARGLAVLGLLGFGVLLGGCATVESRVVVAQAERPDVPATSPLREGIGYVGVRNEVSRSRLTPGFLQGRVESYLRQAGVFDPSDDSPYFLQMDVLEHDEPWAGREMTVTQRVRYTLSERETGEVVYSQEQENAHTAQAGEAWQASDRIRIAREGALQASVDELIERLLQQAWAQPVPEPGGEVVAETRAEPAEEVAESRLPASPVRGRVREPAPVAPVESAAAPRPAPEVVEPAPAPASPPAASPMDSTDDPLLDGMWRFANPLHGYELRFDMKFMTAQTAPEGGTGVWATNSGADGRVWYVRSHVQYNVAGDGIREMATGLRDWWREGDTVKVGVIARNQVEWEISQGDLSRIHVGLQSPRPAVYTLEAVDGLAYPPHRTLRAFEADRYRLVQSMR